MNDAERAATEEKIHTLVVKWKDIVPLGLWHFIEKYQDRPIEGMPDALGETEADWKYLHATITWYVTSFEGCPDDKLEQYVVHEIVHCLLNRLEYFAQSVDEKIPMGDIEQDTQLITFALLWAYNAGWNAAKDSLEPDVYELLANAV